jgi:hypothetical protein
LFVMKPIGCGQTHGVFRTRVKNTCVKHAIVIDEGHRS